MAKTKTNNNYRKFLNWGLVFVSLLALGGTLTLEVSGCNFFVGQLGPRDLYGAAVLFVISLTFIVMGSLIIHHQPNNRIGWVAMIGGTMFIIVTGL